MSPHDKLPSRTGAIPTSSTRATPRLSSRGWRVCAVSSTPILANQVITTLISGRDWCAVLGCTAFARQRHTGLRAELFALTSCAAAAKERRLRVDFLSLMFAVDSLPGIFAMPGLRALYFAQAATLHRMKCLKYTLALLLVSQWRTRGQPAVVEST